MVAVVIGALGLASAAFPQSGADSRPIEPLIEGKVTADPVKRLLRVDLAWPQGLKPRFPREEIPILFDRMIVSGGPSGGTTTRVEENPEWAALCERAPVQPPD